LPAPESQIRLIINKPLGLWITEKPGEEEVGDIAIYMHSKIKKQ